ncbi:radical SAM protein [bacterium]|nr:radical SAM protein [bacterium]
MKDPMMQDSHKLAYHPRAVADWHGGKPVTPIHCDIGLTKRCQIKCVYCIAYTQGEGFESGNIIPKQPLLDFVSDFASIGGQSIAMIGDGEPTMNPAWLEAARLGYLQGLDMAIATNGLKFQPGVDLAVFTWARFNISAGTREGYHKVHGVDAFDTVCDRIKEAVDTKRRLNLDTTIGLQMVPMPAYAEEAIPLAKLGKDLGVDYTVIKQCCISKDGITGPMSIGLEDPAVAEKDRELFKKAQEHTTEQHNVIVKWDRMETNSKRPYGICYGAPFIPQLSGDGCLYSCGPMFGHDEYKYLDITKERLSNVYGTKRWYDVQQKVYETNINKDCNSSCRCDAINCYLYDLKHNEPMHKSFI